MGYNPYTNTYITCQENQKKEEVLWLRNPTKKAKK